MKRILVLTCCIIIFSNLPAFAQNYSGQWLVEADVTYATAHSGLTHGSYRGFVTVTQTDFSPPMLINVNGNLQLYFSDDSGYPPEIPLDFNVTMTDPNTLPAYSMPLPPPYDILTLTVNGSVNGNSASGLITSSIIGDGPGPISGTWNATKSTTVPTMTDWGMIILVILLCMGSIYYLRRRVAA